MFQGPLLVIPDVPVTVAPTADPYRGKSTYLDFCALQVGLKDYNHYVYVIISANSRYSPVLVLQFAMSNTWLVQLAEYAWNELRGESMRIHASHMTDDMCGW